MAPTTDDSPDQDSGDSNIQESSVGSEAKEEEEGSDDFLSDSADSKCSVTIGADGDSADSKCSVTVGADGATARDEEQISSCQDSHATHQAMSQAADSADTTWTDDKHSSYLNSIEATFVQKLYGKEYCSLDVCGQSSQSTVTLEQECVESHPFCFNIRQPLFQPFQQQQTGGWQYRASSRSWTLAPSVIASPWIQHFKSKHVTPLNGSSTERREEGRETKNSTHGADKSCDSALPLKQSLDIHTTIPTAGSLPNLQSTSKKHGISFSIPDCKGSVNESRGEQMTMKNLFAGRFKKIKYQQKLPEMDMEMEHQFISRQCKEAKVDSENDKEDLKIQQTPELPEQSRVVNLIHTQVTEVSDVKQSQFTEVAFEMGSSGNAVKESISFKRMDQVVPSFDNAGVEQTFGQILVPEMGTKSLISDSKDDSLFCSKQLSDSTLPNKPTIVEPNTCRAPAKVSNDFAGESGADTKTEEHEKIQKRSSSKTWTWGIQSPRRQLSGRTQK